MIGITTCPKCRMRVLPKDDGTCPSCQAAMHAQGSKIKTAAQVKSRDHPAYEEPISVPWRSRKPGVRANKGLVDTGVFERKSNRKQSKQLISAVQYNSLIGAVLIWGLGINWLMVRYVPVEPLLRIDFRLFLFGYFASCFLGVYLFSRSANPWTSFIGYNFVVVPFGFVINIVVSRYDPSLVLDAVRITGLVTLFMMLVGALFPIFFSRIISALSFALLAVIVMELVEILIFQVHHGIIDWVVALIFCGYIGYDWGRANRIPKTVDNAVDSAAALYMDIINLFVRILRILGRRRR